MFGLARSSDLVKWSSNRLIITPDSIKGQVFNSKEQRKGKSPCGILFTEINHLSDIGIGTYKGRRKPHSGGSVFIKNEGKLLDVKDNNIIDCQLSQAQVLLLASSKSHSNRSALAFVVQ
ncbi:hypothetical protein ACTFIW_003637 [Dictyostelium discoideum]